jgi:hypothetical protein
MNSKDSLFYFNATNDYLSKNYMSCLLVDLMDIFTKFVVGGTKFIHIF